MTLIIESFYFLSLVLLCFKQCKFLIKRIWILFQFPMQTSIIIKPLISNACPFAIPLMLIHLDHLKFQSQHFEVDLLDLGCVRSSHVQVCNWVSFLLLLEKQVLWRLNTIGNSNWAGEKTQLSQWLSCVLMACLRTHL